MLDNKDYNRSNNKLSKKQIMKKIFFSLSLATIYLVTCADHCGTHASSPTTSYFKVGGVYYDGVRLARSGNQLLSEDNNNDGFQVFFKTLPTVSATYNIVSEYKVQNNTLATNELAVQMNIGSSDTYLSTGSPAATVDVSVSSTGQISLTLPTITVEKFSGGPSLGTTTATGSMHE